MDDTLKKYFSNAKRQPHGRVDRAPPRTRRRAARVPGARRRVAHSRNGVRLVVKNVDFGSGFDYGTRFTLSAQTVDSRCAERHHRRRARRSPADAPSIPPHACRAAPAGWIRSRCDEFGTGASPSQLSSESVGVTTGGAPGPDRTPERAPATTSQCTPTHRLDRPCADDGSAVTRWCPAARCGQDQACGPP